MTPAPAPTALLDQCLAAWRFPANISPRGHAPWQWSGDCWRTTLSCVDSGGHAHALPVIVDTDTHSPMRVLDALGYGLLGAQGVTPESLLAAVSKARVNHDRARLTWTDPVSGLIWMRKALPGRHIWNEALGLPGPFNASGGCAGWADWRFPSIDDLKTLLVDPFEQGRHFRADVFDDMAGSYARAAFGELLFWSASRSTEYPTRAWCVGFRHGSVCSTSTAACYGVRLVRAGRQRAQ